MMSELHSDVNPSLDEDLSTAISGSGSEASVGERLNVFISCRTDPDSPLASALKRLVESTIDPFPNVFVSGKGGIRPANVGFKTQLQVAARNAHAFVAIITDASKDREWITFEAGAAWGQNRIYAPLMVGVPVDALPNTIDDYHAIQSDSKEKVEELLATLASCTRATIKRDGFGQRFRAFRRVVQSYLGTIIEPDDEPADEVARAIAMAEKGDTKEAIDLLRDLESKTSDPEELSRIATSRIRASFKQEDVLSEILNLPKELSATFWYNLSLCVEFKHPLDKIRHMTAVVSKDKSYRGTLAKLLVQIGEIDRATELIFDIIADDKVGHWSEPAVNLLCKPPFLWDEHEELMIRLSGLRGLEAGYQDINDMCSKQGLTTMGVVVAERLDAIAKSSSSANALGIALTNADLKCHAFDAYGIAAAKGASVALCNQASLVANHPNAAAGLTILKSHGGDFDAAESDYPFRLRSDLERELRLEAERKEVIVNAGRAQLIALWAIADRACKSKTEKAFAVTGVLKGSTISLVIAPDGTLTISGSSDAISSTVRPFGPNLRVVCLDDAVAFVLISENAAEGVYFRNYLKGEGLEWLRWQGKSVEMSKEVQTDAPTHLLASPDERLTRVLS